MKKSQDLGPPARRAFPEPEVLRDQRSGLEGLVLLLPNPAKLMNVIWSALVLVLSLILVGLPVRGLRLIGELSLTSILKQVCLMFMLRVIVLSFGMLSLRGNT